MTIEVIKKIYSHNLFPAIALIERFGGYMYTDFAVETWDRIEDFTDEIKFKVLDELEELNDFT